MTSRERVACAFERRKADRIPFGDFCIDNRCVEAVLGRPTPIHNPPLWLDRLAEGDWDGLAAQEADDWVELALSVGLDWISLDANWSRPDVLPVKTGPQRWEWRGGTYSYDPQVMLMCWPASPPVPLEEEARGLLSAPDPPPSALCDDQFEVVRGVARRLRQRGLDIPLAMRADGASSVHHRLELIALYPDAAEIYFNRQAAWVMALGTKAAEMGASILSVGGHLGGNRTSLLSPKDFRRFILPPLQAQIRAGHRAGAKMCVASGGCVQPFAQEFLVESGADGYRGIDTYAGMDLGLLHDQYGKRICLIGGVDSVLTLARAGTDQVREETLRALEWFKDRPGFMLASSNSIHNGVPPENFLAMIEAHRSFYGL